jgi:hypothetical protein
LLNIASQLDCERDDGFTSHGDRDYHFQNHGHPRSRPIHPCALVMGDGGHGSRDAAEFRHPTTAIDAPYPLTASSATFAALFLRRRKKQFQSWWHAGGKLHAHGDSEIEHDCTVHAACLDGALSTTQERFIRIQLVSLPAVSGQVWIRRVTHDTSSEVKSDLQLWVSQ